MRCSTIRKVRLSVDEFYSTWISLYLSIYLSIYIYNISRPLGCLNRARGWGKRARIGWSWRCSPLKFKENPFSHGRAFLIHRAVADGLWERGQERGPWRCRCIAFERGGVRIQSSRATPANCNYIIHKRDRVFAGRRHLAWRSRAPARLLLRR